MGILTAQPRKKGLLADPMALLRAAPDDYAPLANPIDPQMAEQPMTQPQSMLGDVAGINTPIRKPHFFEEGGMGRILAGTLGDTLSTWAGGQANYGPMMRARQAAAQEQKVHDRDLQDTIATFRAEQDYKRANPAPVNNDTENDYNYILKTLGPEAATQYLKNFAAGPPIIVRNPDGTVTPISRDSFTNGSGAGPQPPSTLPPDFDFGDGGPKPSASGTFPDWRGAPGTMTSGRRTVEGNRMVGGVPNSGHLRGDKADYVGTTAAALRAYYGSAAKILDERTHLDVSLPGYGRFPYYGKRGTTGLK